MPKRKVIKTDGKARNNGDSSQHVTKSVPAATMPTLKSTFIRVNQVDVIRDADQAHYSMRGGGQAPARLESIPAGRTAPKSGAKATADDAEPGMPAMGDIAEQIVALGATQLQGHAKREYEAKRLVDMGARAPRRQRMPFRMAMGIKRKRDVREKRQRDLDRAMGLKVKKKRKQKRPGTESAGSGLKVGIGRLNRGVLKLSRREIQDVSRSTTRQKMRNVGPRR